MKKIFTITFLFLFLSGFSQKIDTLRVYENDTTLFNRVDDIMHRPCSNPELVTYYELKAPKDSTYYFIYNEKKQLKEEGLYTQKYIIDSIEYNDNFFNVKSFSYKNNGKLYAINYQEDGRNLKTAYYNGVKNLKSIKYFDKKTEEIQKIEYYKNNELNEAKVYTNFYANKYYTVVKCKKCKHYYNKDKKVCPKCGFENENIKNEYKTLKLIAGSIVFGLPITILFLKYLWENTFAKKKGASN